MRNLFIKGTDDLRFIFNKLDFDTELKIEARLANKQHRSLKISPSFDSSTFLESPKIKEDGKVTALPTATTIAASPNTINGLNFDLSISDEEEKGREYHSSLI